MKKITTLLFVAIAFCLTTSAFAVGPRVNNVRCESQDQRVVECGTGLRHVERVMLVRQHSHAPCIQGRSFGITRYGNAIWAARGCRGDFQVRGW